MGTVTGLQILVVDDEPLAREGIRLLLETDSDIEAVHECTDGQAAVEAIIEMEPNLVFLDVQMPELDGFEVLEAVGVARMPHTIFVTAYDKYALQAFEVHALDYLLKPFTNERFFEALQRAKAQISFSEENRLSDRLSELLEHFKHGEDRLERLAIKSAGRIRFLDVEKIDWIEASDAYLRLHVGRESHLVRGTMSGIEARLDPGSFLRIHRSTIINLKSVKELQPLFHGEYAVTLLDGTYLTSGRSYREKLQSLLDNSL
jgi:two-component system LytT family response regulator